MLTHACSYTLSHTQKRTDQSKEYVRAGANSSAGKGACYKPEEPGRRDPTPTAHLLTSRCTLPTHKEINVLKKLKGQKGQWILATGVLTFY